MVVIVLVLGKYKMLPRPCRGLGYDLLQLCLEGPEVARQQRCSVESGDSFSKGSSSRRK